MKLVIYTREQKANGINISVENQIKEGKKYAEKFGLDYVIYNERGNNPSSENNKTTKTK